MIQVETLTPLLSFFLLLLFTVSSAVEEESKITDKSALLQFKSFVSSDPAGILSQWSDSAAAGDHCSWTGVSCNSASRVVALNISRSAAGSNLRSCSRSRSAAFWRRCGGDGWSLSGTLSPAVAWLSELRVLSLPFNDLNGEIPGEIWELEQLEVIDLEGNSLSGTLPSRFPPQLRVLNLASNSIRGEIPRSLSSSVELETLDLHGNQLSGTIPSFLDALPKLKSLFLSYNRFCGRIPEGIGNQCWSLEYLDLSGNQLTGGIPRSLGNCSKLQSLLLFSNLLGELIPPDLGRLANLRVLDVSRNSLSGSIPGELGNCTELLAFVLLNLYDPMFGEGSSSDENEFNYFQGQIPESVTALPKLRLLWAPRARLEGEIPSNWGACESLEMVNFGENLFTGEVPTAFGRCKNLRFLNLSSNTLVGWLSEELQVPCLTVFDISGNQLTGSIPKFVYRECPSSQLPIDELVYAYYSFFLHRSQSGASLPYLESSGDSGIYHNFGRNNFTGALHSLPIASRGLGNRTVYAFIADDNYLVGPLTDVLFEKCNDLNHLILNINNNLIHGGIPAEIRSMCGSLAVFDAHGNQITGEIPQSLGLMVNLVSLDLSRNQIGGQIPASFIELKGLKYLSLSGNNLSGQIPTALVQMRSLKVLDLSSNSLTGEIPSHLADLRNLTTLLLNNNKLSGKIPSGLANISSLTIFNVSFNNLSGSFPRNASNMRCDSFIGNPLLRPCLPLSLSVPPTNLQGRNGDSQAFADSAPPTSPTKSRNTGFTSIEIASIASASAIFSVLVALVALYIYTRRCAPSSSVQSSGRKEVAVFIDIGVPLTYENVVRATGGFNASNCIGSGGFGATYKAEISPGVVVAIKRLSIGRFQGIEQFQAEIKTLGRWRHPNLVTLIGYHVSDDEMFLIYNYLPGGNLERFIQERFRRVLDWRMLHKIALDVAHALAYLHDHCVPRILHRDVKPSNILLDNDFNAYLSDFGLARLLGNSETHATTGVAGTFGYVAPEYAMTCRVSDKADVYSYGVVLLELISDKKVLDPSFSPYGNGFNIVAWAGMLLQQGRAREFFTQGLWEVGPHDDLVETLHLAITCTNDSLSIRPTMKQVVRRLKELQSPDSLTRGIPT